MEPTAATSLMVLKQVQVHRARQMVASKPLSEVPQSTEKLLKDVATASREDGVGVHLDRTA